MTNLTLPICRRTPRHGAQGKPRARWQLALACLLACLLAFCGVKYARSQGGGGEGFINREYPLKALFLYNFGGYVEWPDEAFTADDQPFVIGILGNAPLDDTLHEIALERKVAGRRIAIERYATLDAVRTCQILFVARDVAPAQQRLAIEHFRGRPVLVVGETEHFAAQGGCVNFYIESNKIRFEINLEAARQQHLRISAKLLALAKIVR